MIRVSIFLAGLRTCVSLVAGLLCVHSLGPIWGVIAATSISTTVGVLTTVVALKIVGGVAHKGILLDN